MPRVYRHVGAQNAEPLDTSNKFGIELRININLPKVCELGSGGQALLDDSLSRKKGRTGHSPEQGGSFKLNKGINCTNSWHPHLQLDRSIQDSHSPASSAVEKAVHWPGQPALSFAVTA